MLAYIARLGFALFTAAILLLHFLSPEFNPLAQGISYYALGQFGWLFTVSLLFLGFAAAALVLLLWRRGTNASGYAGLSLLAIWIIMLQAGAFFAMDAPGSLPTLHGRIHSIAGLSFLLNPPAALLIQRALSSAHPLDPERRRGWTLAWSVVVASGLLITFNGFLLNLGVGGIAQRAYWITIIAWLFLLAQPKADVAHDELSKDTVATTSRMQ